MDAGGGGGLSRTAGWDGQRWPGFSASEIACRCCGEVFIDDGALDALVRFREGTGERIAIVSGHRCALHNARVGGAPLSMHKKLAFDIALGGHDPARLLGAARAAGFTGFGFGRTFLHLDTRARPVHWFYGQRSKAQWTSVLSSIRDFRAGFSAFSATSSAR